MSGYTEKTSISWKKMEADAAALAEKIKAECSDCPKKILSITRGGLIPAALLTRHLDIKDIETIGLESYHGQEQADAIKVLKEARADYLKGTLIVDDLVDTGKTFQYLKSLTRNCVFAVLYTKPKGKPFADFSVEDFAQDTWIDFPWEI